MIRITVEFANTADAITGLRALGAGAPSVVQSEAAARQGAQKQATPAAKPNGLTYEKDVKPLALALSKSDYDGLKAIWTKLGVAVGSELKPEQFADAITLIKEADQRASAV